MELLTNRLEMVAGLLRDGRPFADIGTDHAYLPVAMLLKGRAPSAAACDVGEGPLANAAKTVEKYGLTDRVELVLCSGFEDPRLQNYTDFCMAGMGGNLMVDLLAAAPWLQREDTHLVLQPQSHAEDVRDYLFRNGFSILQETATVDSDRVYIAMEAVYTGVVKDATLAECYIGELAKSPAPRKYDHFRTVLHRLSTRREALLAYPEEKEECDLLASVIQEIEAVLAEE